MPSKTLLSDEPTLNLVAKAQAGDRASLEALLQRSLPGVTRWAHGRLPPSARSYIDTGDVVQETALHVLRNLDTFEPRHVHSMQGYLKRAVINRIRDELRRVGRHPPAEPLAEEPASDDLSAVEVAIRAEAYEQYRNAAAKLGTRERKLIVARLELQWSYDEIARSMGIPTANAARVAVGRAMQRLNKRIKAVEPA